MDEYSTAFLKCPKYSSVTKQLMQNNENIIFAKKNKLTALTVKN